MNKLALTALACIVISSGALAQQSTLAQQSISLPHTNSHILLHNKTNIEIEYKVNPEVIGDYAVTFQSTKTDKIPGLLIDTVDINTNNNLICSFKVTKTSNSTTTHILYHGSGYICNYNQSDHSVTLNKE